MSDSIVAAARRALHARLVSERVLANRRGKGKTTTYAVTSADRDNAGSVRSSELMAEAVCKSLGIAGLGETKDTDDNIGAAFARAIRDFVEMCLQGIPSTSQPWTVGEKGSDIRKFAQYEHLDQVDALVREHAALRPYLGTDYLVTPDIVVSRMPLEEGQLGNALHDEDDLARHTMLRAVNNPTLPLLHASVSCKWTMRSDRAQNVRTEALNMIRNRKGRVPAMTAVTAEPMPSRLLSLAGGTGDLDRVYHVALYELQDAWAAMAGAAAPRRAQRAAAEQQAELTRMVTSLRLADISDLPFDLII
jgi:hypothetical protein